MVGQISLAQVLRQLTSQLPKELLSEVKSMESRDVSSPSRELRLFIYNECRLWDRQSPLFDATNTELADDAMLVIVEALWYRLKTGSENLEKPSGEHP